jgi:hypothetical protein
VLLRRLLGQTWPGSTGTDAKRWSASPRKLGELGARCARPQPPLAPTWNY